MCTGTTNIIVNNTATETIWYSPSIYVHKLLDFGAFQTLSLQISAARNCLSSHKIKLGRLTKSQMLYIFGSGYGKCPAKVKV